MSNIFERIVDTTAAMASVDKASIPLSKGSLKRWITLSDFWSSRPDIFNKVFYNAIMHIATGRYPNNSSTLKPLLVLVEEAILYETDALRAWKSDKEFSYEYDCVEYDVYTRRRLAVRNFAIFRLRSLTIHREEFCESIDIASATWKEINKAREKARSRRWYENFRQMMLMFIPDAKNWNARQWTSEREIFNAFKKVHGIDFSQEPISFMVLVVMMDCKMNGRSYYRHLFRIKHLPDSMAAIIWPKNIIKELSKQLLNASRAKPILKNGVYLPDCDSVAPAVVNSSWAYRMLAACDEKRKFTKAVRDSLLYFGWGYHPRIVKEKQRAAAAALQSA